MRHVNVCAPALTHFQEKDYKLQELRASSIPEFKANLIGRKLQATANDRHDVCLALRTSKLICRANS